MAEGKPRSTDPPKCKICGFAHRGTCADNEARGAISSQITVPLPKVKMIEGTARNLPFGGRRGGKAAAMREVVERALGDGKTVVDGRTGEARGAGVAKDVTPFSSDVVVHSLGSVDTNVATGKVTKTTKLRKARKALTEAEKRGRGRPKTIKDMKAYKAQKARERRAKTAKSPKPS